MWWKRSKSDLMYPATFDVAIESLENVAKRKWAPHQVLHVVVLAARGAANIQIDRTAAALTYRTLFSLVPVMVIGLAIMGAFASSEQMNAWIRQILDFTGLNQISIDQSPIDDDMREFYVPGTHEPAAIQLDSWISSAVARVKSLPFKTIGWIGTGVLIYAALSMLVEIERAFNEIYKAPSGRSWLRRLVLYWTLLTLGPIFLLGGFFVRAWLASVFSAIWPGSQTSTVLTDIVPFLTTTAISAVLFLVVFAIVPNTKVRFLPALVGAVFAAILWESGKLLFAAYLRYTAGYATFYGSLAVLPLFMLWVYLTWIIVLIGLQLAYSLQSYRQAVALARQGGVRGLRTAAALLGLAPESRVPTLMLDPASLLAVMAAVGRRFALGKVTTLSDISRDTGIDERVLEEVMRRLLAANLLVKLDDHERDSFNPSRPLDTMPADQVLSIGDQMCAELGREEDRALLAKLRGARSHLVAGKSIADIMHETVSIESDSLSAPLHATMPAETGQVFTSTLSQSADIEPSL